MKYSIENIARFMLFVTVTIAELILVVFLFVYGSSSLHLIYTYTAGMFTSALRKPKLLHNK